MPFFRNVVIVILSIMCIIRDNVGIVNMVAKASLATPGSYCPVLPGPVVAGGGRGYNCPPNRGWSGGGGAFLRLAQVEGRYLS